MGCPAGRLALGIAAALALGALRDPAAIPVLEEMAAGSGLGGEETPPGEDVEILAGGQTETERQALVLLEGYAQALEEEYPVKAFFPAEESETGGPAHEKLNRRGADWSRREAPRRTAVDYCPAWLLPFSCCCWR